MSKAWGAGGLAAAAIILLFDSACSTTRGREEARNRHAIQQVILPTLHVRRPDKATDKFDEKLDASVDDRFNCRPYATLFSSMDLKAVAQCMNSVQPAAFLRYRLRRYAKPVLRLEDPEKAPACVRELLAEIPVPREILFQSFDEDGDLNCYSAGINLEADELFYAKLPMARLEVIAHLPPGRPPQRDEETVGVLLSWSMASFWEKGGDSFDAKLVSDAICRTCIGEANMVKKDGQPPLLWP